jgi:hypothetical protein
MNFLLVVDRGLKNPSKAKAVLINSDLHALEYSAHPGQNRSTLYFYKYAFALVKSLTLRSGFCSIFLFCRCRFNRWQAIVENSFHSDSDLVWK